MFGAAAAFSAGVELEIDRITGASDISATAASFTFTVPVALFLVAVWWAALHGHSRPVSIAVLAGAALVLCDPLVPIPTLWSALVIIAIVVVLVRHPSNERDHTAQPVQS